MTLGTLYYKCRAITWRYYHRKQVILLKSLPRQRNIDPNSPLNSVSLIIKLIIQFAHTWIIWILAIFLGRGKLILFNVIMTPCLHRDFKPCIFYKLIVSRIKSWIWIHWHQHFPLPSYCAAYGAFWDELQNITIKKSTVWLFIWGTQKQTSKPLRYPY